MAELEPGVWAAMGAAVPVAFKFLLDFFQVGNKAKQDERKDVWDEAQKLRQELVEQLQTIRLEMVSVRESNLALAVENASLRANIADVRQENAMLTVRVLDMQTRLGGLAACGRTGLIVVDDAGLVQIWSNRMQELFGWSADEIIGKRMIDFLLPKDHRERHGNYFERLREMHVDSFVREPTAVQGCSKSGSVFECVIMSFGWRWLGRWTFAAVVRQLNDKTGLRAFD